MKDSIKLTQLPSASIIKLGFFSNLGIWLPFGILVGLFGLFGFDTVRFGENNVYGFVALIIGPMVSLIFTLFGTIAFFLGASVIKFIPWFSHRIKIQIRPEIQKGIE